MVDELWHSATVCRNDWSFTTHCFHNGHTEGLAMRREDKKVCLLEPFENAALWYCTQQYNFFGKLVMGDQRFELAAEPFSSKLVFTSDFEVNVHTRLP